MQIEIFEGRDTRPVKLAPEKISDAEFEELQTALVIEDLEARINFAKTLGLTAQLKILVPLYNAYALRPLIPYAFLSKEEEEALARIFPTRYTMTPATVDLSSTRTLPQYRYDVLPLPVLETWARCVEQRLFSSYEIWTAEKIQKPDPVLIGRRYEHPFCYLLARWGDALRPWDQLLKDTRIAQTYF